MNANASLQLASGVSLKAAPEQPRTQICLLGSPRILVDGATVTPQVKYRKGIALLALLAVECEIMHPRERIANLLWPDRSRTSALTNLRQVLSNLLHVLGQTGGDAHPIIRSDNNQTGLFPCPQLDLDVHKLKAHSAALQGGQRFSPNDAYEPPLHRFLEGFELPDCEEFNTWLDNQRRHLDACTINLHERAIAHALARDDLARALLHARLIERIEPLLELNQVCLMRLLLASGRPKQALRQFDHFAEQLRVELDVDPEPATLALHKHMLERVSSGATRSLRPKWHFDSLTNTAVMYVTCDTPGISATSNCPLPEDPRAVIRDILERHGGDVIDSHGLGQFAYFNAGHDDSEHGRRAIAGAQELMRTLPCASLVRIGIFSGQIPADRIGEPSPCLAEFTELSRRLGFVADQGCVVVCADSLGKLAIESEYLGEWRFRGIERNVHAYCLGQELQGTDVTDSSEEKRSSPVTGFRR
ncbi:MAG: BTAD domain-containing putative transcriptional regulator [Rhodanobacteraceae bacterium]